MSRFSDEARRFLFMDAYMEQLKKEEWQTWADIVRSEQMEAADTVKLFEDNPEFAQWYFTHYRSPR